MAVLHWASVLLASACCSLCCYGCGTGSSSAGNALGATSDGGTSSAGSGTSAGGSANAPGGSSGVDTSGGRHAAGGDSAGGDSAGGKSAAGTSAGGSSAVPTGSCHTAADCPASQATGPIPSISQCLSPGQATPSGGCGALGWCGQCSCGPMPQTPLGNGMTCKADADCPAPVAGTSTASVCDPSRQVCTQ